MDHKFVPVTGGVGHVTLTPESIKFNRFLKLTILEHKPLLACFGFVTSQKWLVSREINLRKRLNLIDVGAEIGRARAPDQQPEVNYLPRFDPQSISLEE